MRTTMRAVVAVLVGVFLGCGSAKDPSKSNFKKALNAHFEKHCVGLGAAFPAYLPTTDGLNEKQRAAYDKEHATDLSRYNALISAGLLSVRDGEEEVKNWLSGKSTKQPARVYELTDEGKRFYKEERSQFLGKRGTLCAATLAVDSVDSFAEPAQMFGYTVSRVNYTYSAGSPNEWAREAAVQAAYPELKGLLAQNKQGHAALVLMNTGWVHEKDVEGRK